MDLSKIDKKSDPIIQLIEVYKKNLRQHTEYGEIFKWKLLGKFKGRPDTKAADFYKEINSISYSNLVYQMAGAVIKHIARESPEKYRKCFEFLFDEKKLLLERIKFFREETLKIYREMGEKKGHHHDERTMATILTFHNPEKYTFYKDSYYQDYCRLTGIESKKKNEKYIHYLELIDDLVNKYIKDDQELIGLIHKFFQPEYYQDENYRLLAQDILFMTMDVNIGENRNYWRIGTRDDNSSFWDLMKSENKICIGWSEIGNLEENEVETKRDVESLLRDEGFYNNNNSLLSRKAGEIFNFFHNIKKGDVVLAQDGASVLGIGLVKDEYIYNEKDTFSHQKPVEWKVWEPDIQNNEGLRTSITKLTDFSLIRRIDTLLNTNFSNNNSINNMNSPLNQILFGPPGTGKTYNSIDKAVDIASSQKYIKDDHIANKLVFDELRKQGQIEFVTFHQNYSYEDFIVGISPDVTSGNLRFDKREGIFKQLAERAKQNWMASSNKKDLKIDFNSLFNSFFAKLIEEEVKEIEIPMRSKGKKFKITSIDFEYGKIKFTKNSGGTGHDLLVRNLKDIYEGNLNYSSEGLGVYYYPLIDQLNVYAKTIQLPKSTDETLKNFVLVIDEINRANISKVFGELITLLEDDKRLGAENELKITLPNGERDFGIPPNLYIIGTMNTADKSIALIDIALRRRFEFIGYYPACDKLNDEKSDLLIKINEAIYKEKKSADFLIGHAYFMKEQPIKTVLQNKVIPLLMEYFSGKVDIVSRIFTETGWNVSYDITEFKWIISEK